MVKPKLLITLGCSYTQGVGCFGLITEKIQLPVNRSEFQRTNQYHQLFKQEKDNFPANGWPNRLGRKLGYDKVLNLGMGGSSTSGQLKIFSERFLDYDFSKYEVLVVWMLTESSRFSFYTNGWIRNLMPSQAKYGDVRGVVTGYIDHITDINVDPVLEQIFYVKMMEQICENKGYDLLLTHAFKDNDITMKKNYNSTYYLKNEPHTPFPPITKTGEIDVKFSSPYCMHLNELGYEYVAQDIFDKISENHKQYINPPKDTIEWIWGGSSAKQSSNDFSNIMNFLKKTKKTVI